MKLNKLSKTTMSLAAFAGLALTTSANAAVTYVDLSQVGGTYTVGANTVNVRNTSGTTSDLKDITGNDTAIDVTLANAGSSTTTVGLMPSSGTDGYNLFNGFVDAVGVTAVFNATTTVTFSDLDPNMLYDIALLGNRINDAVASGDETFTISDVDASNNISSVITTATTSAFDLRSNTISGYIARWDGISPGADGDLVVTISGDSVYLNAVRLESVPEPTTTALLGLGGLALILRRRK